MDELMFSFTEQMSFVKKLYNCLYKTVVYIFMYFFLKSQ